ncbi:Z1 domain-containing protein [Sphingobacterium faecium]|uniref:Z1 domain-containing protein n=1 Tax=Sphingobacterium faecium TaxID=34087 RepID=UPI0024790C93|nr:Z1 domain-containing protein [Sphingobacterium faecium]WGQ14756.1 Z1 domain-containing protein [Sphingobacterium faecium]
MSFYNYITEKRQDSKDLKLVMEAVVSDLQKYKTDEISPGILLGLIQSGKTRAFLGVMAKCFDDGYDVTVVLTKNSVALVEQTIKRLKSEFELPINSKKLYVWDIIKLQNLDQLTGYILENKVIFVVKKEMKNMDKLHEIFKEVPQLKNKSVLIIDDEADQASVSFTSDKTKIDGVDFAKIARSLSSFRINLKGRNSFLQVTATPYSLYLQPEDLELNGDETAPNRPVFTHLLEPHNLYIGGEYYFENATNPDSTSYYVYNRVANDQIDYLNGKSKSTTTYNKKSLNNVLTTPNFKSIRDAVINYLVGGSIRQIQEEDHLNPWAEAYHSAFVLHTSVTKAIHSQQKDLVIQIIHQLNELSKLDLINILKSPYNYIKKSLELITTEIPSLDRVMEQTKAALENEYIGITVVNSENQVAELLGEDGQLRLDNPFNIFIGGQTLDRGITIDHLIGFYYGRNPINFQMDTVLQHSRMYGSRSKEDLAVTRFYTSYRVYDAMRNMHFFDQNLRENIESNPQSTVRFIAKQGTTIKPCGPNKIKASSIISFKEFSRFLPTGFQTRSKTNIQKIINDIDKIIHPLLSENQVAFLNLKTLRIILEKICESFTYEPQFDNVGLSWDINMVLNAVELALRHKKTDQIGLYYREGRETSRTKNGGLSFTDAPDDGKTDLPQSKLLAHNNPVLMLLKQTGLEKNGWRGAEFYWPVIIMPANMPNFVYSED